MSPFRSPAFARPAFPRVAGLGLLLSAAAPPAAGQVAPGPAGLDVTTPVGAYLNGVFPAVPPGSATGWAAADAFPGLKFANGIWLTAFPGTDDLVVAEKTGRVYRFPNRPDVTEAERRLILNLRSKTEQSTDQGFYSLVFHPTFGQAEIPDPADPTGVATVPNPNRGAVFVCYSRRAQTGVSDADRSYWTLSRFTLPDGSEVIDPGSESVLMSQFDPHRWHNGGAMFFGPRGCLFVCNGDGGNVNDAFGYSQRLDFGFFGGVFRIDVDNDLYPPGHPEDRVASHPVRRQPRGDEPEGWEPSFSAGYQIPDDNPWQDSAGGTLEEFFALGLRSPHTMHYDPEGGAAWIGDVGQTGREELNRLPVDPPRSPSPGAGLNFAWPFREGDVGGRKPPPAVVHGVITEPVHSYDRGRGGCIIGGFVYRGSEFAQTLGGKVLFGEHVRGVVWALDPAAPAGASPEELVTGLRTGRKSGLGNFCRGPDGEVYLMDLNGLDASDGAVRKLVATGVTAQPPDLLSQTGAFADTAGRLPAPFLLPYEVASPFWSDGAVKRRWIALPNDGVHDAAAERITFAAEGNWSFPQGTVFVKHFDLPVDAGRPGETRPLETRFIVAAEEGGRYGVTYRWLPDGSDARLLAGAETGEYTVRQAGGEERLQTWFFPGRGDCLACHTRVGGQALGVRAAQLAGGVTYPSTGRRADQLTTWDALGMFDRPLTPAARRDLLEARGLLDTTAPLEHRVRSYLDANCANCHQPGGATGLFDARLETPLSAQGWINGSLEGDFDLGPDGVVVKPGEPSLSALYVRLAAALPDAAAMPPLAKNRVHAGAADLVRQWVESLDPAAFVEGPGGRPIRAQMAAPPGEVAGDFPVTLVLDREVDDLGAGDFQVAGGAVVGLRGRGYYYVATVRPSAPETSVFLPEDAVGAGGAPGTGNRRSNTVTVRFVSPSPTYRTWAQSHGLSLGAAHPLEDGDGDGIANLAEFLFNLDPLAASRPIIDTAPAPGPPGPSGLPALTVEEDVAGGGGQVFRLRYLRRRSAAAEGFRYRPQAAVGLGGSTFAAWADLGGGGAEAVRVLDDAWEEVSVTDRPPPGAPGGARFWRVLLSAPGMPPSR